MPALRKSAPQSPARKLGAAGIIAILAAALATLAHRAPGTKTAMGRLDDLLYDTLYRLRPVSDQTDGPVVIVAADDTSLADLAHGAVGGTRYGWPWPRQLWGYMLDYFNRCGARAVAIDLVFSEPSVYNDVNGDDPAFAAMVAKSKIPVIFGTLVDSAGHPGEFAPPLKAPKFGAVNVGDDVVYRAYRPTVNGFPSLASATVRAVGGEPFSEPFLLHYYGPHRDRAGKRTFRYITASHALGAAVDPKKRNFGVPPEMLRGKIILIGAITVGTFDLKASPLSAEYPGVEVQATAIQNMLTGTRVTRASLAQETFAALAAALVCAVGVVFPRRVIGKLGAAAVVLAALVAIAAALFLHPQIHWLPLASPLIALILATVGAFAWSYMTEGRQRRLVVRALSQYVSPSVAAQIDRDPAALRLGGERRLMTVMFTDIQGFTDLSERLQDHQLTDLLNYYLDEMSALVFANDGTLDKYIGDAIMSFWNAPLHQPDHAVRACRAALAMERREREIQANLESRGATGLLTRIGINTGPMVFGNMGSSRKFNYSVLGDAVNLASRLEGANKFYGSRILLAEPTAEAVRELFLVRKLDVLRVKGKLRPMAVYELLGEATADADRQLRATEYEAAFALYERREWNAASARLSALRERFPDDLPAAALLSRVNELREHPPGPDWDGVYVAKGK